MFHNNLSLFYHDKFIEFKIMFWIMIYKQSNNIGYMFENILPLNLFYIQRIIKIKNSPKFENIRNDINIAQRHTCFNQNHRP